MTDNGGEDKRRNNSVQSVERSLSILEALAASREPLALGEISSVCKLKLSTAHRLLATLVSKGFASQNIENGKYRLGLKTFQIGNAALYSLDLRSAARPHLIKMVDKCEETANLAVLSRSNHGYELVYIDQVESPKMIRTFARVGSPVPIHCTGSGKMLLALLDDRDVDLMLRIAPLEKFTQNTITDRKALLDEIKQIRQNGYALDLEETEIGVACVSAPIRNYENKVIAAVSVSGPVTRVAPPYDRFISLIKETADSISQSLGYMPPEA